ncbi:TNF receptor-associated factor 3-like [Dysidea avara]|uniref:TNF receptor-associated factor 3-like n=1 Tax=Dysidea avara TaxID=196820 RepID=UPI00331A31CE
MMAEELQRAKNLEEQELTDIRDTAINANDTKGRKMDEVKENVDVLKEQMKAKELELANMKETTESLKKAVDDKGRELKEMRKNAEERDQVVQESMKQMKEMFEQELMKLREEVKMTKQQLQHQVEINEQLQQDLLNHGIPILLPHLIDTSSQVLPAVVKVTEFEKCKRNNKYWQSPAFYTNTEGYKMCLKITPNGVSAGSGTHVSVDVYLMSGEHDDQLTWPAKGILTIQILNQISDSHHGELVKYRFVGVNACQVKEQEVSAFGVYSDKFISHKNLYVVDGRYQYFKNNCVFFRVADFQQDL